MALKPTAYYELRFRAQFLESKATAFQDLFVAIMSKAYPGDFIACRPWGSVGDRKNDGYLKSERSLFQVYAPNELRARETIAKIEEDFTAQTASDSPFTPFLVLQNLGYGWRVDNPQVLKLPPRFEPQKDDVIGTWLAPPSAGWSYLVASELEESGPQSE